MQSQPEQTVLLFGSFDGIHPGHEYLINKANTYGSNIIVVVAQDSVIKSMKKQPPVYSLEDRMRDLGRKFPKITVVAGDSEEGVWSAIKKYTPGTIIVGYDQKGLKEALEDIQKIYNFTITQCDSFYPEQYKSSLLRKK